VCCFVHISAPWCCFVAFYIHRDMCVWYGCMCAACWACALGMCVWVCLWVCVIGYGVVVLSVSVCCVCVCVSGWCERGDVKMAAVIDCE